MIGKLKEHSIQQLIDQLISHKEKIPVNEDRVYRGFEEAFKEADRKS